jgi:predicted kinase
MQQIINYGEILQSRKYDRTKAVKQQHITFTIQEKIIAQLGSYCVFTGQAKSGKSTFISATIASAYLPDFQDNFGIKLNLPKDRRRIGYFDTESAEYDFYKQIDKIKYFCLKNSLPKEIDAFNTREDAPKTIRELITEYLKTTPECSVLVIDGFLDLCFNYNDEVETRLLTNWFKKITKEYNITIIGVLHTGKGSGETLGHLGSNTDRWANSTLIVEKDKQTKQFILKSKFLRSSEDFEPISIQNFDGRWAQVNYIENEIKPAKKK